MIFSFISICNYNPTDVIEFSAHPTSVSLDGFIT
nr:MAG TPA: docking domain containing protein [Crassvirales sp.]